MTKILDKQMIYWLTFLALISIPLYNQSIENKKHRILTEKRAALKLKTALIGLTKADIKPVDYENCFTEWRTCTKITPKQFKKCMFTQLKCFSDQTFLIKVNYELEKL